MDALYQLSYRGILFIRMYAPLRQPSLRDRTSNRAIEAFSLYACTRRYDSPPSGSDKQPSYQGKAYRYCSCFWCWKLDSNQRRPKPGDLQSPAIAARRFQHINYNIKESKVFQERSLFPRTDEPRRASGFHAGGRRACDC